jgi:hypothetical protein
LGAENHAFAIDVRKKGGGAAFLGVSEDVVNRQICVVVHYCAFLYFPKSPIPKPSPEQQQREKALGASDPRSFLVFSPPALLRFFYP